MPGAGLVPHPNCRRPIAPPLRPHCCRHPNLSISEAAAYLLGTEPWRHLHSHALSMQQGRLEEFDATQDGQDA